MLDIYISMVVDRWLYFNIEHDGDYYSTSEEIANFFNLDVDLYNQLLVDKVIQHNNYSISEESEYNTFDALFGRECIDDETYVDRFKEAFAPQLTLLALEES